MQKNIASKIGSGIIKISMLSLMVVFGLSATGCTKTTTTTTVKTNSVKIWRYNQDYDAYKDIIDTFQKANANSVISYANNGGPDYEQKSIYSLAAKKGPDIWSIPNEWLADHEDKTLPLPDKFFQDDNKKYLNTVDEVKKMFPKGIWEQLIRSDGKIAGMPSSVESLVLYYNDEIFNQAYDDYRKLHQNDDLDTTPVKQILKQAPNTWNELVEQEKYITQIENNKITRSTIALGTADNIPYSNDILSLLMLQNGVKIVGDNRSDILFNIPTTSPSGVTIWPGQLALDFYTAFSNPKDTKYTWDNSMPAALDSFGNGQVAMVIGYPEFGKQLKEKYPKFNFGTSALPQPSISATPINLIRFSVETVSTTASNPTMAFNLLKSYTDIDNQKSIPKEIKTYSAYSKTLEGLSDGNFEASQILTGTTFYKKNHAQFDGEFTKMINSVVKDGVSSKDAVSGASQNITKLYQKEDPNPKLYEKK